jgi:flagellar protein FlaG
MTQETTQIGGGVNPVGTLNSAETRVNDERKPGQKESGSSTARKGPIDPDVIVKELNETMKMINTRVSFSVDRATKKTVVKVVDTDTGKIIRQIPTEEMLHISAQISRLLGIIVDDMG